MSGGKKFPLERFSVLHLQIGVRTRKQRELSEKGSIVVVTKPAAKKCFKSQRHGEGVRKGCRALKK